MKVALVPRRDRVVPSISLIPTQHHLIFFLQQTEVLEEIETVVDDEQQQQQHKDVVYKGAAVHRKRGRQVVVYDDEEGAGDGSESEEEEVHHRPVVIMSGVTMEGVSVALKVDGWTVPMYVMPSPKLVAADPSSSILFRFIQEFMGSSDCKVDVVFAPRAYGYVPDPCNPAERARVGFVSLRFGDMRRMRWKVRALSEALSGTKPLPHTASATMRANYEVVKGNATIEESERLKPEFKFLDEREIPPSTWVVVSRTKWTFPTENFSYRTVNAVCTHPSAIWSLSKLLENERLVALLQSGCPDKKLPRADTIPPFLLAYCDIESRSHDRNEFPDPTHPDAPCYMVGISLVWAFSVPPCLVKGELRETGAAGELCETGTAGELRETGAGAGELRETAEGVEVARVRQERAERLARRRERLLRYGSKNEDFKRILFNVLQTEDLSELNSDDESDGEERAVSAAVERVRKEKEQALRHRAELLAGHSWDKRGSPPVVANHPFMRILLVLGETEPIPDAVTICFSTEKELLESVRKVLFEIMDVDGIRGYNWLGFDTRYIVRRAELHNISSTALRWSHLIHRPPKYDRQEVSLTLQRGLFRMIRMHYTNTVDIMVYMRQQLDLSSYKLEAIAENFGLEGKHPVTPDDIYLAYEGTPAERSRVGAYCLRDCDVLVDIARASQFEITILQFSRIMLTPCELMWTSGQQIRVIHQLIWQAHRSGFIVDGLFRDRTSEDRALRTLDSGKNFSGGFVMKPVVGHHRTPTATLDYKSLYPSIMISHKLCYSTALLHPYDSEPWIARIEKAGLEVIRIVTESGKFAFVQHAVNLIPDMEWKLWVSRQMIKKEMKKADDPLTYSALDAKQLAVKVSMNSTFGVTGAEHAFLGMKRIAAAITHVGRSTVQAAREFADSITGRDLPEAEPGVPILHPDAKLRTVYGDTDSIMVNLPDALTPEFVRWAREKLGVGEDSHHDAKAGLLLVACRLMGDHITENLNKRYRHPMEIEFEEVASEAIFLKPKMYTKNVIEDVSDVTAGQLAKGMRVGKLKVAGIAAKRRDRSALTKRLQKAVAQSIIQKGDDARAMQLVRRWITRLVLYEINVEDFLITTELKNPMERVGQAVQPWVAVAWAMEHACKGSEPIRGERVPWLVVRDADPTRIVPPESKKTGSKDVYLGSSVSSVSTVSDLISTLHSELRNDKLHFMFGTTLLNALTPTTAITSLGLQSGHKLFHFEGSSISSASPPKPIPFRVHFEDEGELPLEDELLEDEILEDGEQSEAVDKKHEEPQAPNSLSQLMFRARELSEVEKRNLGKRRVESDSLSPYARHPSEIKSIKEVDVDNYLKHIIQALSILLEKPRPDLWNEMDKTIKAARPLVAYSQGKPVQRSLMGFFKKG